MFTCPQCHKNVKDLKGHLARVHPEGTAEKTVATKKPTGKKLELAVKARPKEEKPAASKYHCVDCGAAVTKGQTPCPSCGAGLDWSQVE